MTRFWLQRHDMFRELGATQKEGTGNPPISNGVRL